MKYETPWWSIVLPPGCTGEPGRSIYSIRSIKFDGVLVIHCLKTDKGLVEESDLQHYAGDNRVPYKLQNLVGYFGRSNPSSSWALSSSKSDKIIWAFYNNGEKEISEFEIPEVKVILESIELK